MKSLDQILKQESVFLHEWTDAVSVLSDFADLWKPSEKEQQELLAEHKDEHILFASYGSDNYEGDAFVLYEKNGKLYEVNGSHCSCFGLEGQWEPEEVILSELENRLLNGTFGEYDYANNEFKKELCDFLGIECKFNDVKY